MQIFNIPFSVSVAEGVAVPSTGVNITFVFGMCKFLTFEKLNKIKTPVRLGQGVICCLVDMSAFVGFEGVHGICVCVEQYVKTHTKLNLVLY